MKFFSLIEKKEVHIAPEKKTIPAKEFSKLVEADSILKQIKEEELAYRKRVLQECEALKEQADLVGFEEGLKRWNNQIELLDREIKDIRQKMENSMVPLAMTAVKKIIGKELETKLDTIVDIISSALKAVTQHKKIKIFVSPAEYDTIETARPRLKELYEYLDSLTIVPRKDIGEGGCIIETEAGIINAQLESQLKALEAAFHTFFKNQKKKGG